MLSLRLAGFLLGLVSSVASGQADTVVLYQPQTADTLSDQGFLYVPNPPFGASVSAVGTATGTTLSTSAIQTEYAGFFTHNPFGGAQVHSSAPTLDRTAGIDLQFELAVLAEAHVVRADNGDDVDDRGGFSVIVIASDMMGIEIAFWQDEIWAYDFDAVSKLFTHAEGVPQVEADMQSLRRYDLTLFESFYALAIDGATVLSGALRDYTGFTGPTFPLLGELDPYEVPNMIFLGDDTSSASSTTLIGKVSVTFAPANAVNLLQHGITSNEISMTWESLTGIQYLVESSDDLDLWDEIASPRSAALSTTQNLPVPDVTRAFYRVSLKGW